MAKEVVVKIKVDGQEIDAAKLSTKQFTEQVGDLRKKLEDVPVGSKDFKKIQGDIDALEGGFKKAKQSQQGFIDNLSELPGIAGTVGQSMKGVKGAFDLLASNPLIAVFSLLAAIVLKVADQMKKLEGVMDPLEKITGIVSGLFEKLVNLILPPVAALLEGIAAGAAKVANFFGNLFGAANDVGDSMTYVADTMDQLSDSQAAFALAQEESNRKLQEARELAADQTKTSKERIQALRDAAAIEKKIAEENRARELAAARAKAVELATALGYNKQQIDAIKTYDAAKLKSFAAEIQGLKALDREKSNALYASLGLIAQISADEAKINKKTQTQITGIENEEQAKRQAAAKEAAEQKKDYERRLVAFKDEIRLLGIKDEQEKARVSLEIERRKAEEEIKEAVKNKTRRAELLKQLDVAFDAKDKQLKEKQEADNLKLMETFDQKAKDLSIAAIADDTERSIKAAEAKYERDLKALRNDEQFKKKSKEEQSKIEQDLEKAKNAAINKINEDDAKKKRDALQKYKDYETDTIVMSLQNQLKAIDNATMSEIDKIKVKQELTNQLTKENEKKQLDALKLQLDNKEITETQYQNRKAQIEIGTQNAITENAIKTEQQIAESRQKNRDAVMMLANSIGALGQAMGEETAAGKALIKVQQGLALATTLSAIADQFKGLGQAAKLPFPANIIAIATFIGTIGTAVAQFKTLFGMGPKELGKGGAGGGSEESAAPNYGKNYGDGGMIDGPRHAQGGVLINAEGGEAVISRGAVTMFKPMLSMMNQMGGGVALGSQGGTRPDAPSVSNPAEEKAPLIMKTYVVASDMTTEQQRQARLKDLSTL